MSGNDKLIGAKVVEVSGHTSEETDWQAVAKIPRSRRIHMTRLPTKTVMHYGSITVELDDGAGTRLDLEPNSYYDSYWIEVR